MLVYGPQRPADQKHPVNVVVIVAVIVVTVALAVSPLGPCSLGVAKLWWVSRVSASPQGSPAG